MINRQRLVSRHNPKLTAFEPYSPLSVGNGEFVFTADVTGLQSFNELYEDAMPLCTMANWGWHSVPFSENIKEYDWLRQNPHKFNLARVGFVFEDENGRVVPSAAVSGAEQELDLYTGILHSRFEVNGHKVYVKTAVCAESDTIAVEAESELISREKMYINIVFPYPSHLINGGEWFGDGRHYSQLRHIGGGSKIEREIDDMRYEVVIKGKDIRVGHRQTHKYFIKTNENKLSVTIGFVDSSAEICGCSAEDVFLSSEEKWRNYWENGGVISLERSADPRAFELERRIILSQYVTALQCGGSLPPAETGLTCNSWYGKFHLEMHFWNSAHFALYGRERYLEKSIQWYFDIIDKAKQTAEQQGYEGARWPKMVGSEGIESPSPIGPRLIWQQPHTIVYCYWLYKASPCRQTLEKYREIIEETAKFMVSFAKYDGKRYVLGPPVIPVQERFKPNETTNPAFELEYWVWGLKTAVWWFEELGLCVPEKWTDVIEKMAVSAIHNGVYVAHENSPDTFENVNTDHPSMLMAFGVINGCRIDKNVMNATLDRVLSDWRFETMWGWDFGVAAMTAVRLGKPELALNILLKDAEKNQYAANGHNKQGKRKDLPLYLPGNGALLIAAAMMAAGYDSQTTPGFNAPGWNVEFEGIMKYSL